MGQAIATTEQNWNDVVNRDGPVLVDFWAPWCGWCQRLAPGFERLASEYAGRVAFVTVNVDEQIGLAQRYGVQGLPTLKFFCDGREVEEVVGYLPEPALRRKIDQVLALSPRCAAR